MPVKKPRRRYFKFVVEGPTRFTASEVFEALVEGVRDIFGLSGLSRVDPHLIDFDEAKQEGVLRCNRTRIREMRASLTLISKIGGSPATVYVTKVSGTIKALKNS
ncbi:MAG: hypothetical protein JSV18_02915 [Candidatus Bathyarchaeota archaeon]|nr:MAG: hypothetical protein JSV18_02915 [Candidatus Bathyarchaeota archaeon]